MIPALISSFFLAAAILSSVDCGVYMTGALEMTADGCFFSSSGNKSSPGGGLSDGMARRARVKDK
jgi:hypothetical protein